MDKIVFDGFEDRAKGCLVGALCGDAIGTLLEFQISITKDNVSEALTLPGGGPFKVGKGQITDDGELTLCLGHGLAGGKNVLDLNLIADSYRMWIKSKPFDVGSTIGNAVSKVKNASRDFAKKMRFGALDSKNSQSNGSLMKITPLCIWCSELSKEKLIECVKEETQLTHPHKNVIDVNIAYVYTIQHLLKHEEDYVEAYKKCKAILGELDNREVLGWIKEMETEGPPGATLKIGWCRIAFTYALFYLKNNKTYLEAMSDMLSRGGDTDTNCCIVGGMIGALHGFKNLPPEIVSTVMKFDPKVDQTEHKRPEFLVPGKSVDNILREIIENRPNDENLQIIGKEENLPRL